MRKYRSQVAEATKFFFYFTTVSIHNARNAQMSVVRVVATTFCTLALNICGSSVWTLLHGIF